MLPSLSPGLLLAYLPGAASVAHDGTRPYVSLLRVQLHVENVPLPNLAASVA